jgi:hypothetical protein
VIREFYSTSDFISWRITRRYRQFDALADAV